jgi:hypothetical protein
MPRYFFDVDDGDATPDRDGSDLCGLTEAKCEAVKMAGRIICDQAAGFWDRAEWTMTVSDETRLTLFTLHVVGIESAAGSKPFKI